ncbi:MAG: SDR family NAD(P)-dependent oxidoreductase, partial [Candidatus Thorarchaeota archaeon]
MDTGLAGKHILITGASGGIGLVTARLFLSEGAKVTGTFNRSAEPLQGLVSDYSDSLKIIKVDQTSEDDVRNLFTKANQSFGRVDVLVANAAISVPEGQSIQDMTLDRWDNTLRVNLTGSFLCAKHFFSNLEEYSGESASLILVGSTAGLFGEAWYVDYSTSKAAMHGMMMSLKNEIVHLAPLGRVNLVNP